MFRLNSSAFLLLLAAAAAPGQTDAGSAAPGVISGTVTNSVTGEPIVRAHISLQAFAHGSTANQQTYGALSNAEGNFSIADLPPGEYMLDAERVGFATARSNRAAGTGPVSLKAGEKKDSLHLTLTPAGALTGRVLDADGEPVAFADVRVQAGDSEGQATTDLKGRFRIGGLTPGKYRVKATMESDPLPPEIRQDNTPEKHYAPTYYPNVLEENAAARVDVQPAAESSGIDIRLVQTPIVSVTGKITGIPPGANVILSVGHFITDHESNEEERPLDPSGVFQLWRLDPGKYTLEAIDRSTDLRSAPMDIEVATANLSKLELRMLPAFAITGHVRFDGAPARPPRQAGGDRNDIRLSGGERSMSLALGADGSFSVQDLQPGIYHVERFGQSGYVESVLSGATESQGNVLDLRNGPSGPVVITIGFATAEVSGIVRDSKGPVAGAQIMLVSAGGFMESTASGPDGKYFIGEIAPGQYKLAALDEQNFSEAYQRSQRPSPDYRGDAETLELHAGDKLVKDLKVLETGK